MEMFNFTLRQLTPGERAPGTHWIGGLGPQSRFERYGEKKNLSPVRNSNPAVQYVMLKLVVSIVTYRGVTVDGVLDSILDLLPTLTHDS
jgi:hypothetical protein